MKPNHTKGPDQQNQTVKFDLNVKVLLTVFFDCNGEVHHEFLPKDWMVNEEYYLEIMRQLRETIRQKLLELW